MSSSPSLFLNCNVPTYTAQWFDGITLPNHGYLSDFILICNSHCTNKCNRAPMEIRRLRRKQLEELIYLKNKIDFEKRIFVRVIAKLECTHRVH